MIDFNWPWIFLLLPLPLLALIASHARNQKANNAIRVSPRLEKAFQEIQQQPNGRQIWRSSRIWQLLFLWLAWLTLLIAIAQPTLPAKATAQAASGRALSLLIDLSTSMERKDITINDEAVDRLTVVKQVASQFIANRTGDRMGLVLFGSEAFIGSPLSYDLQAVNHVLQSSGIGMAGRTTAMGDALGLAIQTLKDDPATEKAIVLLSDGTNNAGTAEPEDAARLASSLGIRVYTIGLGSESGGQSQQQFQSASADLDEETLKAIARESGALFFRAHTSAELEAIYTEIDTLERTDDIAPPLIIKQDLRNTLIIATLLSCLLLSLLHSAMAWRR